MWITFDLDGVVMENPFGTGVFPHVIKLLLDYLEITDEDERKRLTKEIMGKIREEYKERFRTKTPYIAYNWDQIITDVFKEYDYPFEIDVANIVKEYCVTPHIKSYDQVDLVFKDLKKAGTKIGIISNGYRRYQKPVLEALGLYSLVDEVITPEEVKKVKPELELFTAISEIDKSAWIHVGDTLVHDVYGGKLAGAKTAWIYRDLPEDLRRLSPDKRAFTTEGEELVYKQWAKERRNYPDLCENWRECQPDLIIYSLKELVTIDLREGR